MKDTIKMTGDYVLLYENYNNGTVMDSDFRYHHPLSRSNHCAASSFLIAQTPCRTSLPSRGRIFERGNNEFEPQKRRPRWPQK
jgi:hypothetical protein